MNTTIFVVYYADGRGNLHLIKAFGAERRAAEYVTMLQQAPFPGQLPGGYQYQQLQLN